MVTCLENIYPFQPRSLMIDGHRMSYLDEGRGPAVVMLHGNPSWSFLYRDLVLALRDRFRCIVPDHLGCGFSDKPDPYPYTLRNHIDNLETLLGTLGVERCILVVHDWGGAIGMGWAGRYPAKVAGLVVFNTAAFRSSRLPFRIALCRWPLLGAFLVRGLNGFARAALVMAVAKPMNRAVAQGYLAPYDSWRNRIALHRFVEDIPMHSSHQSWSTLVEVERSLEKLTDHPMLVCWGGRDFCFNESFFREWRHRFPKAEAHWFADAGHYLLEDAFTEILPLVERFSGVTLRESA